MNQSKTSQRQSSSAQMTSNFVISLWLPRRLKRSKEFQIRRPYSSSSIKASTMRRSFLSSIKHLNLFHSLIQTALKRSSISRLAISQLVGSYLNSSQTAYRRQLRTSDSFAQARKESSTSTRAPRSIELWLVSRCMEVTRQTEMAREATVFTVTSSMMKESGSHIHTRESFLCTIRARTPTRPNSSSH